MDFEPSVSLGSRYGRVAVENRDFPAIIREDHLVTHGNLWDAVRLFAVRMQKEGVQRDSIVCLNTKDMVASVATLFATSLLGARLVIASKTLARSKVVRPTHFFRTPEVTGSKGGKFKLIDESWTATLPGHDVGFAGDPAPDADWLYLHTSGTTGRAKYIALSEKMVSDRTAAVAKDFPFQRTTLATVFSSVSRPFFARAIATLLNAGSIVDSRSFDLWKMVGVNLVCGSPRQVGFLLEGVKFSPRIRRIEVSGAKLPDDIAADLLKSFDEVVDVYGAAETNKTYENIVTLDSEARVVRKGRRLDSDLQIVSAEGRPCAIGEVGSVRIRNSYMVKGYLNAPEANAKSFRDGWFYPGDIATWGENDELTVIGRDDDIVNVGGYKLNGAMVDMLFCSVPGIRDAISFANPKPHAVDKVLVFAVFEKNAVRNNAIETACQLVKARLGLSMGTSSVMSIDAIPRTEKETPDRVACRAMVLARSQLT